MVPLFYLSALLMVAAAEAQHYGRIAFQTFRAGNWEIYLMAAVGGEPINLTASPSW